MNDIKLHEVMPRENAGRDTIARFQAQFRAAAYAALSILHGKDIDRVYCDYHDDFVVRHNANAKITYHFHQVKTKNKRNHQWGLRDIFGLSKRGKQSASIIQNSFVGKLLIHTIKFQDSCLAVTLLTNVQFEDDIEDMLADLASDSFQNKNVRAFIDHFRDTFDLPPAFEDARIKANIKKLSLNPGITYLNLDESNFIGLAWQTIYDYSEIDLQHIEAEEIIRDLLSLIERKSFQRVIANIQAEELDDKAGVGIEDLLEILSISKGAYARLLAGGDPKALKSASIIQRKLEDAGATDSMIEYCSHQKTEWDKWVREKRHMIPEFDFNFLLEGLASIQRTWARNGLGFPWLQGQISNLYQGLATKGLDRTLSVDLLLGGVFSAMVRSEAQ